VGKNDENGKHSKRGFVTVVHIYVLSRSGLWTFGSTKTRCCCSRVSRFGVWRQQTV